MEGFRNIQPLHLLRNYCIETNCLVSHRCNGRNFIVQGFHITEPPSIEKTNDKVQHINVCFIHALPPQLPA